MAQVVHDYRGVCQAVTELAAEENAPITADEFRVFNRCLDEAIAEAVTEFTHQREHSRAEHERQHLGELAHELRNAAIVSFEVLRTGKVGLDGNTAGVLSRSLRRLSALIDGALTEVRLESGTTSLRRLPVRELIEESAAAASMDAHASKEEELFRPFEQRGADRSGLGLGLSIARKSVEASGGKLGVGT